VISRWFPKRVFPYMTTEEINYFWDRLRLSEDDWDGLTRYLLDSLFGLTFMVPHEPTDRLFALKVFHPLTRRYAKELWPYFFSSTTQQVKLDRSEFEKLKPTFEAPRVKIRDVFEPSKIVQKTFHPWRFGEKSKTVIEEDES